MNETKQEFLEMVTANQGIIHKICRLYASGDDYQDLYQDMLVNLWNGYGSFNGQSKISTWLYRVALYTALNHRRNASYRDHQSLDHVTEPHVTPEDPAFETIAMALGHLSPEERALMILYLEEKSYQEISEILGISVSNTGVRISRIKAKMKEIIKRI